MCIWSKIRMVLGCLPGVCEAGAVFDRLVEAVRERFNPEARRQVAFTIALIALTAKMAKADGVVTHDEIDAVRRLFVVPDAERENVARLFNLAKQDVAGFESYARRIRNLHEDDRAILEDVVDGLFVVAGADGAVHDRELDFLERVSEIFGIPEAAFERIGARHVAGDGFDPWAVLGVARGTSPDELRRHYRRLVNENHPDRMMARGVPAEAIRLANNRLAAINAAYDVIERQSALVHA
jgi:DnaJ like chaperone protein